MYYINPLSMMQQQLMAQPGGAPASSQQYQQPMVMPAQQFLPQQQMNNAPYYGPAHQALTNMFQQSLQTQAATPQHMQQMVKYPYVLAKEVGGFDLNPISYAPHNDWRIDWFKADREKAAADAAAAAAAASAPVQQGGLLMQPFDTGVRAGQNDVVLGGD